METVTERRNTVFKTGIMSAIDLPKLSEFEKNEFDDGVKLNPKENIDASIIGTTVDYVCRMEHQKFSEAFNFLIRGLALCAWHRGRDITFAKKYIDNFGQDVKEGFWTDKAIGAFCRFASYDVWFRNPLTVMISHDPENINPDCETCSNIRTLIRRTLKFYKRDTVKFDDGYLAGGFTDTVSSGDFDFLTSDTLFDLKVVQEATLKRNAKKYILQVLMYWIIGKHSGNEIFNNITKIGIFNPRSNAAYVLNMSKVSPDIIRFVEDYVICY